MAMGAETMLEGNRTMVHLIAVSSSLVLHALIRPYKDKMGNIAVVLFCTADVLGIVAGTNLIITTENNSPYGENHHKKYPQDIVIKSSHCYEISWIIFQLKEVYKKDINSNNKYEFYPLIGQVIEIGIENNYPLRKIYMNIIEACRNWKNNIIENFK